MQNTMVRGGGREMASRKMKLGVRGKKWKGERKKEENYIKKGGKGLKNASQKREWGKKLSKCTIYIPVFFSVKN